MIYIECMSIMSMLLIIIGPSIVIAALIKDEKAKNIFIMIVGGLLALDIFAMFGVIAPLMILSSMFEDATGIILMIGLICIVWLIISIFINIANKYIINKNKIEEIYIRDIDVEYSPAVLSYLMNNNIETQKDLSATLLNLCANNVLKIKQTKDKLEIVDLKNEKAVSKLKSDEKYAYKMLVEGVTNSKINYWKNKVEEEYEKYRFSRKHKTFLGKYMFALYVIVFIIMWCYCVITGKTIITGKEAENIIKIFVITFAGAWEAICFYAIKSTFKAIINRNDKNEFKDTYTKKGAKEYSKWKSFEKFIETYSLINEKTHESIVVWGKYLSYSIALGINKKCDNELYNKIEKEYAFSYDVFDKILENIKK